MGEKNAFSINNNFSTTVIQSLRGAVVKDQSSIIADSEGVSSNPDEAILLNFVHFFVFGFLIIFFPLACLPLFSLLILQGFTRILQ